MTKKDFDRLAVALVAARKESNGKTSDYVTDECYEVFVDQIALACTEGNDTFNYTRFRAACGLEN